MGMGLFSSDLLIQLTELGGVSVLTFVMASSGCALGEWVSARWRPSPQGSAAGDRVTSLQNSALLLMPNGGSCGACKYDKQQLVPVGERLPPRVELQSIFPKAGRYQAGRSGGALRLAEHWLAVFICYEALDGARVSELVESKDAGLLVNLTSDAWFGRSIEPLQHLLLARLRAVEQRRYMVRAADTGISAIIDPRGRIIQSISLHETRAFVETVHLRHARTLYSRWGDRPWLALSALLALFLVKRGVDRVLRQVRGAPASP